MSLLDLLGVNRIFKAGQPVDPTRKILNFIGDGVTIVDNPGSLRTDITIAAGGGGGGEGTVGGPDTSTAGNVAVWAGVDGTELADGGRSVATDGAKLDGIETGAQVTSFARVASALAAATADVAINAHKLTGVANPTSAQDAATKAYVDAHAGGGVSGSTWTTAVETNFETVPAASLVNGANTVDGRVWQGVNLTTGATSVTVGAAAAGLAIVNSAANTTFDNANRSAPLVTHPLTDSVPLFTAGTHDLRLYGLLETNAARNYELARFGFETVPPTTSFRSHWLSSLGFNNATTAPIHQNYAGISEQAVVPRSSLTNKAFCIIRTRGGTFYYYSKNVGTVLAADPTDAIFTDDLATWTLDGVAGPASALELGGGRKITDAASLSVIFMSMTANTSALLQSRLRRVRLQWRRADAAGNLPAGSGDVVGPSSATADRLASFNGTTGKAIKDSGAKVADLATKADLVKGGWTAALDLNFTQLPAQTFVDGPNSYQGLTIYGRNIASSGAAVNVNANGLDVVHGNAATDISATYTGPNVYLRLGDLIPSFQIGVTDVRIWLQYGAVTPSKNWQLAVFQVERLPDASGNRWWLGGWHGFDTAEIREERYQTTTRIVVPPANNVQCLCLYALKTASLFSGPSAAADSAPNDAAFPLIEAMKPGSSGSFPTTGLARFDAAPLYMADRNAIGFAMGATAAANSAFTARFKRLRIEFRN